MIEFERYRTRPSPETLTALLKACEGGIYNLCYQVLRHPENARDLSQQILLKLLDALPRLSDGEHLKRWTHVVCFRDSLNFQKKLRTRMTYEREKAAEAAAVRGADDSALEIHEHIASLREDLRALVIDHYFERKTMPALAGERGCSTVAIWKKLERAKQSLRDSMSRAGFSAGLSCLEGFLDSLQPVPAPDGLLSPAILAKAGALASGSGVPSLTTTGGVLMTGKGFSIAAVVGIAVLCLVAGMSAGVFMSSSHAAPAAALADPRPPRDRSLPEVAATPKAPEAAPAPEPPVPAAAGNESLPGRLQRFREWLLAEKKKNGAEKTEVYCKTLMKEWKELRPLVMQNPGAYSAFLRAVENEDVSDELFSILNPPRISPRGSMCNINELNLPDPIREACLELLGSGTKAQRSACLKLLAVGRLGEQDTALVQKTLSLLADPDSGIRKEAAAVFGYNSGMLADGDLDVLRRILQTATDPELRRGCLNIVHGMKGVEAESLVMEEAGRLIQQKHLSAELVRTLQERTEHAGADTLPRYATLLAGALGATSDPELFREVARAVLQLPRDKATAILDRGYAVAPTVELRDGIGRALQKLRAGETRRAILENDLGAPKNAYFTSDVDIPFDPFEGLEPEK
ncbi:MAG TPA: sigma-70 family RNA polymerase sigma factor [Planctomycetota bacterium]|nr:sigma-70 family RNA polymerase sigma factor [Planctomycetota bacterium]